MSERFSTIDDSQKIENTADAIVLNVKYVLESPNVMALQLYIYSELSNFWNVLVSRSFRGY